MGRQGEFDIDHQPLTIDHHGELGALFDPGILLNPGGLFRAEHPS